jgi:hypothetical protein
MNCVDLAENASFDSSDVIYWSLLPSSLPDKLSMDKRDSTEWLLFNSKGMYSYVAIDPTRRLARRTVTLAVVIISFCANCLALLYGTRDTAAYYAITCMHAMCVRARSIYKSNMN